MARTFFTGGTMPSHDLLLHFQEDLQLVKRWVVNGKHYSKTLEAWLKKLDANIKEIWPILEATYGNVHTTLRLTPAQKGYKFSTRPRGVNVRVGPIPKSIFKI